MNVVDAGSQGVRSSLTLEGLVVFGVEEERIRREVVIIEMGAQIQAGRMEPVARRQSLQ